MLNKLFSALTENPRTRTLWRAVLLALVCLIAWLALSPAPPRQIELGWDKLDHTAAFAALTVVAWIGRWTTWPRMAAALLAYGALIELAQSFTATRSAEWGDLLADAVGIALGLLVVFLLDHTGRRLGPRQP